MNHLHSAEYIVDAIERLKLLVVKTEDGFLVGTMEGYRTYIDSEFGCVDLHLATYAHATTLPEAVAQVVKEIESE